MSIFNKFILIISIFLLSGCGDNKIDTSSDKALKESIEDIRKSLSVDKLKEFNEALPILMFKDFDLKNTLLKKDFLIDLELSKAKTNLEGKTADEIIAESKIIKQDRILKRKENLKEKINLLEEKKQKSKDFEEMIKSNIKVSNINFNKPNNSYYEGTIDFTLTNNMNFTISSIVFELSFISPNREVPWSKTNLQASISGGIAKDENVNIQSRIYSLNGMKYAELPSDAIPVILITSIYDNLNKKIKEPDSFSNWNESELEGLKKEYESIK